MHPPSDDARCVCGHDPMSHYTRTAKCMSVNWEGFRAYTACACLTYTPVRRLSQPDEDESI